jgi:hypothetical protein
LCHTFPVKAVLKQGDALSPLILCYALKHVIRAVQEKQEALQLNGTHHLLIYATDVNLLTESMATIRGGGDTSVLIDCKQIVRETDAEKAKYMFMSRQKNAGQNNNTKTGNKFFVGVPNSTPRKQQIKTASMKLFEHTQFEECQLLFGPETSALRTE